MKDWLLYVIPATGLAGLVFAFMKASWIGRQEAGTDRMKEIAGYVQDGAMAFLRREYKVLAIFVVVVAVLLGVANSIGESTVTNFKTPLIALSFVLGAFCSGLAGWVGMKVATDANVRTTNAARKGLNGALQVAFSGGTVMGMSVVGLATLGLGVLVLVYGQFEVVAGFDVVKSATETSGLDKIVTAAAGFSLGASSIALFARVGGGIYTKAADVGADLVGKVEAGIPEDDPRNPATIADNVGDNVGDVAGMGADLFESYVGCIIGAMVLGATKFGGMGTEPSFHFVILPLVIAAAGIIVSIGATYMVRTSEGGDPQKALNIGTFGAAFIMVPVIFGISNYLIGGLPGEADEAWWRVGLAAVAGLFAGVLVGVTTEYYCSKDKGPVAGIAKSSERGSAPNIISGIAVGMQSTMLPIIWIGGAILAAHELAGLYGIAIAALGMLCTTGIQLAVDAYGPVADNAGGLAEMSRASSPEVRERTDKLDAVGNTTAGDRQGLRDRLRRAHRAGAVRRVTWPPRGIRASTSREPKVMVGLLLGAMLPYLFSAMAINAVSRGGRRHDRRGPPAVPRDPGPARGQGQGRVRQVRGHLDRGVDQARWSCPASWRFRVSRSSSASTRQDHALGGLLAGVTVSGVLLAIFQANAGGAWDNAKKYIEDGHHGGKGSEAHKAAVQGDTVGDPLKDTSGPSLNILVKLMSVVALVIAPLIV